MNRDEQGGSRSKNQKFQVNILFKLPQNLFSPTKIYDMLIFNLTHSFTLFLYNLNSDTNYLQWHFLRIILNFYQATHISLTQTDSYQ